MAPRPVLAKEYAIRRSVGDSRTQFVGTVRRGDLVHWDTTTEGRQGDTGAGTVISFYLAGPFSPDTIPNFYIKAAVIAPVDGSAPRHILIGDFWPASDVTVLLAGRVARKLGIEGTVTDRQANGQQVTATLSRMEAIALAEAIKHSGFKASTVERHVGRIQAALAA